MQQRAPVFTLWICAIIIGTSLFRNVDFRNFSVSQPALSLVYLLTLLFVVYSLVSDARRQKRQKSSGQ